MAKRTGLASRTALKNTKILKFFFWIAFGKKAPWVDKEIAILPWAGRAPYHPSETDCHLSAIVITTEFQFSFKSSFSSIVRKATKTGFLPIPLSSFLSPLSWMTMIMQPELLMNGNKKSYYGNSCCLERTVAKALSTIRRPLSTLKFNVCNVANLA